MHKKLVLANLIIAAVLSLLGFHASVANAKGVVLTNIDVSQRVGNEAEEAIAINPTNPKNIVVFTNIAEGTTGMFLATSFDGGKTWNRRIVGDNDNLGDACCDPSLSFDEYGNLFMTYILNTELEIPVALSTDGGVTFNVIAEIAKPASTSGKASGAERRGLFRFVDQPTIIAGHGEVWVTFNAGGPIFSAGASVTGLGKVGTFNAGEVAPGTNNCTYGDIAIGPAGQVMQVCSLTETGQGGGKLMVNTDPDGLGAVGYGSSVFVTDTHIGGFNFIPAQPDRSIDAEPGLAWDRSGGPHNGRVYLVYDLESKNNSDDTDVYVRYSDDNGATWSAGVKVNDDQTVNSQFMPKISLDQTTGNLAVVWEDARNDLGKGGAGDTNGTPNDDAQLWGAFSTNGGASFSTNFQISAGTSNASVAGNGTDYGDYMGLSFYGGVAYPAWADNSNSKGNNPDGALHKFDIYTAAVPLPR